VEDFGDFIWRNEKQLESLILCKQTSSGKNMNYVAIHNIERFKGVGMKETDKWTSEIIENRIKRKELKRK